MWDMVVRAVGDLDSVIGFDVSFLALFCFGLGVWINDCKMINEPHSGYVGLPSLNAFDYNTDLHLSDIRELIASNLQTIPGINNIFNYTASAFQSFRLGTGHPTMVSTWTRSSLMPTKITSQTLLLILQRLRPGAQTVLRKADASWNIMMSGAGTPWLIKLSSLVKTTSLDILILGGNRLVYQLLFPPC